ncbi:MAG: DUF3592 domain-containing protein [Halobacteriales archaeon]|nr:DUF3592 domain-containing protein [Halobacteriales archaeon]
MALIETNGPGALALAVAIGVLFMLLGTGMFVSNASTLSGAETTEATVESVSIGESVNPDRVGNDYYPVIQYRYTVDGEEYRNSNYKAGSGRRVDSQFWAEDIVEEYEEGETITVYYTPSEPSNSFIEKSMPAHPYALFGFGLLFFLPAVYMLRPYFSLIDDD